MEGDLTKKDMEDKKNKRKSPMTNSNIPRLLFFCSFLALNPPSPKIFSSPLLLHPQQLTSTQPISHRAVSQRRFGGVVALGVIASLALTGCGDNRAASRPMVLGNPAQLTDLYLDGELTDTKGYRWDVAIIPGISPTLEGAGDSYARAGGYIRRFGTNGLAKDGKSNAIGDM